MGIGLFPAFDPDFASPEWQTDGKRLVRLIYDDLLPIARDLAVTPLEEFIFDPSLADVGDSFAHIAPMESISPEPKFYPIEAGLQTIEALITAIKANPALIKNQYGATEAIAELEQLHKCLSSTNGKTNSFCLILW